MRFRRLPLFFRLRRMRSGAVPIDLTEHSSVTLFLGRWKHAGFDEHFADRDVVGVVDLQGGDRRSPDRRQAVQQRPIPLEMLIPSIPSRIEEADDFVRFGIDSRDARALWLLQ